MDNNPIFFTDPMGDFALGSFIADLLPKDVWNCIDWGAIGNFALDAGRSSLFEAQGFASGGGDKEPIYEGGTLPEFEVVAERDPGELDVIERATLYGKVLPKGRILSYSGISYNPGGGGSYMDVNLQ